MSSRPGFSLSFRFSTEHDVPLLAAMNAELRHDEGHSETLSRDELGKRMGRWLAQDYRAALFFVHEEPVAYALFRFGEDGCFLRQFFVTRSWWRQGVGRSAIRLLREEILPPGERLFLEVLVGNRSALLFWRALGFVEYSLTLEIAEAGRIPSYRS